MPSLPGHLDVEQRDVGPVAERGGHDLVARVATCATTSMSCSRPSSSGQRAAHHALVLGQQHPDHHARNRPRHGDAPVTAPACPASGSSRPARRRVARARLEGAAGGRRAVRRALQRRCRTPPRMLTGRHAAPAVAPSHRVARHSGRRPVRGGDLDVAASGAAVPDHVRSIASRSTQASSRSASAGSGSGVRCDRRVDPRAGSTCRRPGQFGGQAALAVAGDRLPDLDQRSAADGLDVGGLRGGRGRVPVGDAASQPPP